MESNPAKSMSARLKLNRIGIGIVGLAATLLIPFYFAPHTEAAIFSYKDEKGAIHFTDDLSKVPEEFRENGKGFRKHKEERRSTRPASVPAPIRIPSVPIEIPGVISNSGEVQVPLIPVSGGNFLVDVLLNGRVKARLMLDTGASFITLSEEIGQKLGAFSSGASAEMPFNTAGGEEWMPLVALQTVSAGNAQSLLVEASIGKHMKNIDGLLGMSFLGDYRFEIDRTNKRLTLKPPSQQGEMTWGGKPGNWWKGRFEYYDSSIRGFDSRAKHMQRRGHQKAGNMVKTTEFYKDLKQKLESRAMIAGVPAQFR
ncbi:MAG: clan AA aspartic protease (TIGR02281 family) [Nitrospinales bacterium]|jgi:clan AA aspartic protease (TIGR02281 family)